MDGCAAAGGIPNGTPTVVADKAHELFELLCPHRRRRLLPHNLAQDLDDSLAEGGRGGAILRKAADAVVADLKTLSLQTASESTLRVDEALHTALTLAAGVDAAAGSQALAPLKHQPLKQQLKCVDDLLKVYAHTTLSYCSLPIENEQAVVNALSAIVVAPAIKYVKKVMATMCEHIEKDACIFQSEVARQRAQDKGNYDLLFKGISGVSASQNERDAYRRMHTQISAMESALGGTERHDTRQMVSDILQLALKLRSCTEAFTNLVSMIAGGVPGVEWKQRQGFKAFFRMLEKGIMKGSAKSADWKAALSLDSPVDCSKILDGVACIYFCKDFVAMEVLIHNLVDVIANKDNANVRICWIKNRWEQHKTAGGWRDCMINLVIDGVVMEIQIAHEKLYFYREEWGHSA